jgi:hypothetical protein
MIFNNDFEGLTSEEYSDIFGLCVKWYKFESGMFADADKDDIEKSAYFNIVTLNPSDVGQMNKVLKVTIESRSLVRLQSTYKLIKLRLGDKKIKRWQKSFVRDILNNVNFAYTSDHTDALLRKHPYVILIPMLTMIFMADRTRT